MFGNFFRVYWIFGKTLNPLWQKLNANCRNENGQIFSHPVTLDSDLNLAILTQPQSETNSVVSAGTCAGTSTSRSARGTTSRGRRGNHRGEALEAEADATSGAEAIRQDRQRPGETRARLEVRQGAVEVRRTRLRAEHRPSITANIGRIISPHSAAATARPAPGTRNLVPRRGRLRWRTVWSGPEVAEGVRQTGEARFRDQYYETFCPN